MQYSTSQYGTDPRYSAIQNVLISTVRAKDSTVQNVHIKWIEKQPIRS